MKPRVLQRLDRLMADLNVLLFAVAIGLAVLDFTVFTTVIVSDQFLHQPDDRVTSAFFTPVSGAGSINVGR
jgi:hypothetical protein